VYPAYFLPPGFFFDRPCGNQMGTLEVVCDEHDIGGSGEYYGENDAHLGRIDVFYLPRGLGRQVRRGKTREPYARPLHMG
jgi:hypothetical protein